MTTLVYWLMIIVLLVDSLRRTYGVILYYINGRKDYDTMNIGNGVCTRGLARQVRL